MSHAELSPFAPEQLAELLGVLNAELTAQSMAAILQILQGANLSLPRLVALMHLKRHGAATISELSEQLHLALGTTSQAIDQLVQGGLVERREGVNDRRQKLVTLTPAGTEIVARVRQVRLEASARRFAELPPELVDRLGAAVSEALAVLQLEEPAAPL